MLYVVLREVGLLHTHHVGEVVAPQLKLSSLHLEELVVVRLPLQVHLHGGRHDLVLPGLGHGCTGGHGGILGLRRAHGEGAGLV